MSYKTDRLVDLLPDAYAAAERESLLHQLLDVVGAELMGPDAAVKRLLKSHGVDYATGAALDGLGAIYGVARRSLRAGSLEPDAAFGQRLRAVVLLCTGGGTILAVKGAVRSALGLPFDLSTLNVPAGLRDDLEGLVVLQEFPPLRERVVVHWVTQVGDTSQLTLQTDAPSITQERPRIEWTLTAGSGRLLSIERVDINQGIRSDETLFVPPGSTLVLTAGPDGALSAVLGGRDVTGSFANLDGSTPPAPPPVPLPHPERPSPARRG